MRHLLSILPIAALSLFMLSACDKKPENPSNPFVKSAELLAQEKLMALSSDYQCGKEFITFVYLSDKGDLKVKHESFAMARDKAATGTKYNNLGDNKTTFWSKDDKFFATVNGADLGECKKVDKKPTSANTPKSLAEISNIVWVLEDINKKGVIDNSHAILEFGADGRMRANSGCNFFGADYTITKNVLKIKSELMGTKRACSAPALQDQEKKYTDILAKGTKLQLLKTGKLIITTDDGSTLSFMPE